MKTLILFFFVAGSLICFLLVRMPRSSLPPTVQASQSREVPKQTNGLSVNHVSKQPSSLASGQTKTNSVDSEILDLNQHIQAALKTGDLADHDLVFTNLLLELIKKDPNSAAALAESMPSGAAREEMLRRVAQHWTEQDPASAKQWAEQLSNERERNAALTDVCFQIALADPREATQMADQFGLGKLPEATLENLVQQWAVKDLTSAFDWARERPTGPERDQMFSRIAFVMAEASPDKAAQMVVDQIPAGDAQTEAAISVLYQWAKRDLKGARAWVDLFPESPLRERALNELKGAEQYQQAAASQIKP